MGTTASSTSSSTGSDASCVSPELLATASARDVAEYVRNMTGGLNSFAENFVSFDVNGNVLSSSSEEELKQILSDIGIDKTIFQKRLILEINKYKTASTLVITHAHAAPEPAPAMHVFTAPSPASASASLAGSLATGVGIGSPASSTSSAVVCVDGASTFSTSVTIPPREILRGVFSIHGIDCDPSTLDYCVSKLIPVLRERCQGIDGTNKRYDCFISYRVDSDKVVADMLYKDLKLAGFIPFIDSACLPFGESWKDNFMLGLCSSKVFIAVMSTAGLGRARNFSIDHSKDNVLLEYQTALEINSKRIVEKQPQFIIPIHVGSVDGKKLTKFADSGFGLDQYCDEVKGSAVPTASLTGAASSSSSVAATTAAAATSKLVGNEDLDKYGADKGSWSYVGDVCCDGMRHGTGTCIWVSASGSSVQYVGSWSGGLPHGKGTQTGAGSTYEGEWHQGRRQGQGRLVYPQGEYVGGWQQDLYHGRGRLTFTGGAVGHDGMWSCGRPVK